MSGVKVQIESISIKDAAGQYLDVDIINEDHYIELHMDSDVKLALMQDDWEAIKKVIDDIFAGMHHEFEVKLNPK